MPVLDILLTVAAKALHITERRPGDKPVESVESVV
jgi:hypothetical protein